MNCETGEICRVFEWPSNRATIFFAAWDGCQRCSHDMNASHYLIRAKLDSRLGHDLNNVQTITCFALSVKFKRCLEQSTHQQTDSGCHLQPKAPCRL